jgi:hypothetical protein
LIVGLNIQRFALGFSGFVGSYVPSGVVTKRWKLEKVLGTKERNWSLVSAGPPKIFVCKRKPTSETPWFDALNASELESRLT